MIDIRIFVNNELVSNDATSNMLLSVGWEDTKDTIYYERTGEVLERVHRCFSDTYHAFVGDEEVTLCVHKNRVIRLLCNCDLLREADIDAFIPDDAEFMVKTFHLSSLLTEVHLPEIGFHITRIDDADIWVHHEIEETVVDILIPIDL